MKHQNSLFLTNLHLRLFFVFFKDNDVSTFLLKVTPHYRAKRPGSADDNVSLGRIERGKQVSPDRVGDNATIKAKQTNLLVEDA